MDLPREGTEKAKLTTGTHFYTLYSLNISIYVFVLNKYVFQVVGRLVGCLVGCLVGWLVGWLV